MAPSDVDKLRLHGRRGRGASYPHRRHAVLASLHVQILFRQARTAVCFHDAVGRDDMRRQQHASFPELGNQYRVAIVNLGALEVVAWDFFQWLPETPTLPGFVERTPLRCRGSAAKLW